MAESLQPYLDGFIDVHQAALVLGLTKEQLYKRQQHNKGPKRYRIGRRNYYKAEEVLQWADEHLATVYGEVAK